MLRWSCLLTLNHDRIPPPPFQLRGMQPEGRILNGYKILNYINYKILASSFGESAFHPLLRCKLI